MSDFRLPRLNLGERFYRALLWSYPPRFRQAFGLDLLEAFRDERRAARQAGGSTTFFWLSVLQDVFTHASAEWVSTIWRGTSRGQSQARSPSMTVLWKAMQVGELRFALRRLRRASGFAVATVLVLSIGIGATTAVFALVDGILLTPLPFPASERLVRITHTVEVGGHRTVDQSDATVLLYQAHARAFEGIGAWRVADGNLAAVDAGQEPARVNVARVTANLFDVLRVRPAIGRSFAPGEDRIDAARVAIISHHLWQTRFHGDRAAIGRQVVINSVPRTIVGVLPPAFRFASSSIEIWMPQAFDPAHPQPGDFNYESAGRLKDGVTVGEARADLARILPRVIDEYPSQVPRELWQSAHVTPQLESLRASIVGGVSRLLWVLLASVSLLLVIACANVAGLFLVRAESRQLELAVRGALGSGISALVAQSLSEALLLAGVSGALGLVLAKSGIVFAIRSAGALGLPRLDDVGIDARVVLFTFGSVLVCAAFVSVLPMLRARAVPIALVLRGGGRGTIGDGSRQRARSMLVVAQTALALVLVASSGLMARSFLRLRGVSPGFAADDVVMTRILLPYAVYGAASSRAQFLTTVTEKIHAIPGVRAAAITDWIPLTDDHNDGTIEIADLPRAPNAPPLDAPIVTADGGYFAAMSIPLIRGRTFGAPDPARASTEAIVSHAFAAHYWPGESPLGKRVRHFGDEWLTVVGEASDVHYEGLDKPADEVLYFPLVRTADSAITAPSYAAIVVRSTLPPASILPAVRTAVHSLDASLPTFAEQPLSSVVRAASARARTVLLLLATSGAIALLLGAVGLYGVMAYSVSLRRREIGVRIALGARPGDVSRMVSLGGLRLAAIGVAIGIVCALGVTRFLRSLLYDVSTTDPLTLGATAASLLVVAFLAGWLPARRAASIDPSEALRSS